MDGQGRPRRPRPRWRWPRAAVRLSGRQHHGIVYEMMPLVYTLRWMLMLPVTINANGSLRFRWLSLPMAATLAAWLLLAVIAYHLVRTHLDPVSDDNKNYHVWDLVLQYGAASATSYVAFLPYTSWATAGRAAALMDQWRRVEAHTAALRGDAVVLRMRGRAVALSAACLLGPVLIQAASGLFSPTTWHFWMLPYLAHSFSYFLLATVFWDLACRAIASTARQMAAAMDQDLQRLGVRGLRAHRRAWLGLCKVLRLLAHAWGRTHTLVLGLLFVSFSMTSFLLMHVLLSGDMMPYVGWFCLSQFFNIGSICMICNAAQHATDSLRIPATKQLLWMSLSVRDDKTSIEILHFLREIQLECPRVSVCRLALLSRSSILSIFALANTYIVVLSQFTISVEMAETNFTEDPGLDTPPVL